MFSTAAVENLLQSCFLVHYSVAGTHCRANSVNYCLNNNGRTARIEGN